MVWVRRRWWLLAALVLGASLLVWWLQQPASPPVASAGEGRVESGAPHGRGPSRLEALGRAARLALEGTTRVRWVVRSADGEALSGVELELHSGQRGLTDAQGELVMEGVTWSSGDAWSEPIVHGPWMVLEGSSSGAIDGGEQTRLLLLEPSCPGVVRIEDSDGSPLEGARLGIHDIRGPWTRPGTEQRLRRSDGRGEIEVPYRPCGLVTFVVEHEPSGHIPWLEAEVRGEQRLDLRIPAPSEATLAVVDEGGAVVDAELDSYRTEIDRLGVGLFRLRHRRAWTQVNVSAPGYPTQAHRVVLDGGEHLVRLEGPREVMVEILCDERCPEDLSCDKNECSGLDEQRWACSCPTGQASLYATNRGYFAELPADVTSHGIDLRSDASARGRWTGSLPCHVAAEHGPHMGEPCRADGRFLIEGLRPGPNTITVRHGLDEVGSVRVELESGERWDVGELAPDTWTVDGVVSADFPLDAALLFCSPTAVVELERDGGFLLRGLPAEAEELALKLYVPAYGTFRTTVPVPVGGSLPTWRVDQAEIDDTEPLHDDYRPSWSDTGLDRDDTGWDWADTGWHRADNGSARLDSGF